MLRRLLLVASATGLFSTRLPAQTTIYSTFGPGDSFNCCLGYTIFGQQWVAIPFNYSGPGGEQLSALRVAATTAGEGVVAISFLLGPSIGGAFVVESWSLPSGLSAGQIYTLIALNQIVFTPGQTYWVMVGRNEITVPEAQWLLNDQGLTGRFAFSNNQGSTWNECSQCFLLPAFGVSSVPSAVVPEPATITLLATGLVGLGAFRRTHRRKLQGTTTA
jgi:hypothetical protein